MNKKRQLIKFAVGCVGCVGCGFVPFAIISVPLSFIFATGDPNYGYTGRVCAQACSGIVGPFTCCFFQSLISSFFFIVWFLFVLYVFLYMIVAASKA